MSRKIVLKPRCSGDGDSRRSHRLLESANLMATETLFVGFRALFLERFSS